MPVLNTTGVHHITLNGADRQTSMDFWEGVLGMPFVFEQPNLDEPSLNHLYFDPGDGRLITIFTDEARTPTRHKSGSVPGSAHHLAFAVTKETFDGAAEKLRNAGFATTVRDRGFMDSLYFREPLGHMIELACYKFEPPAGVSLAQVMALAYQKRLARGAHAIEDEDWQAAVAELA